MKNSSDDSLFIQAHMLVLHARIRAVQRLAVFLAKEKGYIQANAKVEEEVTRQIEKRLASYADKNPARASEMKRMIDKARKLSGRKNL